VKAYLELSSAEGFPFPDDPAEQLARAATAMRRRWVSPRARRSRRGQGLPEDLPLAFHVQAVRVGPLEASGHGVAQSRDPFTGAFAAIGTFRRGCAEARRTTARVSRWTRCRVAETSSCPPSARWSCTFGAQRRSSSRSATVRCRCCPLARWNGPLRGRPFGWPSNSRRPAPWTTPPQCSRSARRIWRVCCTPSYSSLVGRLSSAVVFRHPWVPPSGASR
jgi:hypothetical protein